MSATHATDNLSLPIFIGTDIPSWLTDWNNTMVAIDAALSSAATDAEQAKTDILLLQAQCDAMKEVLEKVVEDEAADAAEITKLQGLLDSINRIITTIQNELDMCIDQVGVMYYGTLGIGEDTYTFSVPDITAEDIITPYTSIWGFSPNTVEVDASGKIVTLTFDQQSSTVEIGIEVRKRG